MVYDILGTYIKYHNVNFNAKTTRQLILMLVNGRYLYVYNRLNWHMHANLPRFDTITFNNYPIDANNADKPCSGHPTVVKLEVGRNF